MDSYLNKLISMFTSKEGTTFWPKAMCVTAKNKLISANLHTGNRPDYLRLNSAGESTPEEDLSPDIHKPTKKSILGDYCESSTDSCPTKNIKNMNHQSGVNTGLISAVNGWTEKKITPMDYTHCNGYGLRPHYFPACGSGRPFLPPQQHIWSHPRWPIQGYGHNLFQSVPFRENGFPAGLSHFHHGPPIFTHRKPYSTYKRNHSLHHYHCNNHQRYPKQPASTQKENDPVSFCQELSASSANNKESVAKDLMPGSAPIQGEFNESLVMQADVSDLSDTLSNLDISSERCDRIHDVNNDLENPNTKHALKMHINISLNNTCDKIIEEKKCEKGKKICNKCSSQCDYCILRHSDGGTKVTVILGRNNHSPQQNVQPKLKDDLNNILNAALDDPDIVADEIRTSDRDNKLNHVTVHSPPLQTINKQQNERKHIPKPDQQLLAQVLLKRQNFSSRKKKCRPSSKKRTKLKARQCINDTLTITGVSDTKKPKVVAGSNKEVSQVNSSKSAPQCSTIAYILGFTNKTGQDDLEKGNDESNIPDDPYAKSPKQQRLHCKLSLESADRFSFTIGSSDETDVSDDEDSGFTALSEDDAEVWNSFVNISDPYNPLNCLNSCSTPKRIPKSNSAPALLSPDNSTDDIWKQDMPMFSPPKEEALLRKAKRVHFAELDEMVVVHHADDWERKGPWEQIALDAHRFKQRIQEVERSIGWVFTQQHRRRILRNSKLQAKT